MRIIEKYLNTFGISNVEVLVKGRCNLDDFTRLHIIGLFESHFVIEELQIGIPYTELMVDQAENLDLHGQKVVRLWLRANEKTITIDCRYNHSLEILSRIPIYNMSFELACKLDNKTIKVI